MYDNMTERDIAILGQPPRISPVSEVPDDLRGDIAPPSGRAERRSSALRDAAAQPDVA